MHALSQFREDEFSLEDVDKILAERRIPKPTGLRTRMERGTMLGKINKRVVAA